MLKRGGFDNFYFIKFIERSSLTSSFAVLLTKVSVHRTKAMQSDAKHLKFDVVANLQKVSTGRKLRQRLLNFTFDKVVFQWLVYFQQVA